MFYVYHKKQCQINTSEASLLAYTWLHIGPMFAVFNKFFKRLHMFINTNKWYNPTDLNSNKWYNPTDLTVIT